MSSTQLISGHFSLKSFLPIIWNLFFSHTRLWISNKAYILSDFKWSMLQIICKVRWESFLINWWLVCLALARVSLVAWPIITYKAKKKLFKLKITILDHQWYFYYNFSLNRKSSKLQGPQISHYLKKLAHDGKFPGSGWNKSLSSLARSGPNAVQFLTLILQV